MLLRYNAEFLYISDFVKTMFIIVLYINYLIANSIFVLYPGKSYKTYKKASMYNINKNVIPLKYLYLAII